MFVSPPPGVLNSDTEEITTGLPGPTAMAGVFLKSARYLLRQARDSSQPAALASQGSDCDVMARVVGT